MNAFERWQTKFDNCFITVFGEKARRGERLCTKEILPSCQMTLSRLEFLAQGITQARSKEPGRGTRNDRRIHQYDIWIARQSINPRHTMLIVIQDNQTTCRRVVRSNRRHNKEPKVMRFGDALCRINGFSAAIANDHVGLCLLGFERELFDRFAGAFTGKAKSCCLNTCSRKWL